MPAARFMGLDMVLMGSDWHVSDEDFERLRIDREQHKAQAFADRQQAIKDRAAARAALKAQRKQADKDLQDRLWGRYSELVNGDDADALEAFCQQMARERPRYHDGTYVFACDPCPNDLRKALARSLVLIGEGRARDHAIRLAAKRFGVDPDLVSRAYFQRAARLAHNRRLRCLPAESAAIVARRKARKVDPWPTAPTGPN